MCQGNGVLYVSEFKDRQTLRFTSVPDKQQLRASNKRARTREVTFKYRIELQE